MWRRFLPPPWSTWLEHLTGCAALLLVLALAFGSAYALRDFPFVHAAPLQLVDLTRFEVHQFEAGLFLQLSIVPVILMYSLTVIPSFRRALQDQTGPHSTPTIWVSLVAVQLFSQTYEIWFCRSLKVPIFSGFLVIILGSLLGGWRLSLCLGLLSTLYTGTFEMLSVPFLQDVQRVGLLDFIGHMGWPQFLYANYGNPHVAAGLWISLLACLCADRLGPHRYAPLAATALGAGLVIVIGYIRLVGALPPDLINTPAQALITGLTAGMVMLVIRNLQIETAARKAKAAELVRTQAELRALRAQINPHFLFNALNTIRYMIRTDPEAARRLLLNLSEVFQRTLRSGEFVSLRDELSYVEAYLALEKARLGERLQVVWGGLLRPGQPLQTETPLLAQPVPTLALQPLVENAIVHGLSPKKEGGTVTIWVEHVPPDLVIQIIDNGVGMEPARVAALLNPAETNHACIGLCNVDLRLRLLYGEAYRLGLGSTVGEGTQVTLRIPVAEKD